MQPAEALDDIIDQLIARLQAIRSGAATDYPYAFIYTEAIPCQQPQRHAPGPHFDSHFIVGGPYAVMNALLDETETFAAENFFPAPREVPLDDQ